MTTTTKMSLFLRGTAILALTVAGVAANAQSTPTPTPNTPITATDTGTADGKGIDNTVTLTGNYGGVTYEITAFENVDVEAADPDLDITKVATIGGNPVPSTGAKLGDVITYTYTVENTGNVTMAALALTDNHINATTAVGNLSAIVCSTIATDANTTGDTTLPTTKDNTITKLGSGDIVTCTATYTVEQADIDTLQ